MQVGKKLRDKNYGTTGVDHWVWILCKLLVGWFQTCNSTIYMTIAQLKRSTLWKGQYVEKNNQLYWTKYYPENKTHYIKEIGFR